MTSPSKYHTRKPIPPLLHQSSFHRPDLLIEPIGKSVPGRIIQFRDNFSKVEHDHQTEHHTEQEIRLQSVRSTFGQRPPGLVDQAFVKVLVVLDRVEVCGALEAGEVVEPDGEGSDDLSMDEVERE